MARRIKNNPLKVSESEWEEVAKLMRSPRAPVKFDKRNYPELKHSFIIINNTPYAIEAKKILGVGGFAKVKRCQGKDGSLFAVKISRSDHKDIESVNVLKQLNRYIGETIRFRDLKIDKYLGEVQNKHYQLETLIAGKNLGESYNIQGMNALPMIDRLRYLINPSKEQENRITQKMHTLSKGVKLNADKYYSKQNLYANLGVFFDPANILRPLIPKSKSSHSTKLVIAYKALEALKELNDAGYHHHDIKPENMMIDLNLKSHLIDIKLIDFDFAKQNNASISFVGSTLYMAPELRNKGYGRYQNKVLNSYDTAEMHHAIDIYAMGATLARDLGLKNPNVIKMMDEDPTERPNAETVMEEIKKEILIRYPNKAVKFGVATKEEASQYPNPSLIIRAWNKISETVALLKSTFSVDTTNQHNANDNKGIDDDDDHNKGFKI